MQAASEGRAEKVCLVFCQSICICTFFLLFFQLSLLDRAHCSLCDWQSKILLSLLKTSECFCSDRFSGPLVRPRVWCYFGLTFLDKKWDFQYKSASKSSAKENLHDFTSLGSGNEQYLKEIHSDHQMLLKH